MKYEIKRTPKVAIITAADDDGVVRLQCDVVRLGEKEHALSVYRTTDKLKLASAIVFGGFDRTKRLATGMMTGAMSSVGKRRRLLANAAARAAAAEITAAAQESEA